MDGGAEGACAPFFPQKDKSCSNKLWYLRLLTITLALKFVLVVIRIGKDHRKDDYKATSFLTNLSPFKRACSLSSMSSKCYVAET